MAARTLLGYRVAVASRENHREPPALDHRDWLRVTIPSWHDQDENGLAEENRRGRRGHLFRLHRSARRQAQHWSRYWHTRVITVWSRADRSG